jgi:adenine-specific DNA-methyltransferase
MPDTNLDKLKNLLAELFMLDQADLDFGIYRVMNTKRAEITRFLEADLLPQVRGELAKIQTGDRASVETELHKALQNAQALGMNPADCERIEKVKTLRAQLAATVDVTALENEVLSDLANFFRRYYSEGDFLALRRYKAGVYAIPYEGEEVKLHWANADQYYIKTSEYLRDYTFNLPDGKRVHFKLIEADTEADNKKAVAGQERRFILCDPDPLLVTDGELIIRFEYRPETEKRKQSELNALAAQIVLNVPGHAGWKAALAQRAPTEKNSNRTILERHLADYTARNTFDYFIHKDIGGFLRRELDFFIKNEIMHLDDIESEAAPRVEQYLAKIKAIRAIARKIIVFLEQLENFQKKLWLKKKFVVETNWCVTLDRVAESLYPEILANDAQRAEWVRLFAIDEIQADLAKPGYSVPLTLDFLRANSFLVLDTKFFPAYFTDKALADHKILDGAATLDEATDGLLVHSENFQALNLLQARFHRGVKSIYIDPPYNTGNDGFVYKDNYQHSSWLSMMDDRLSVSASLLETNSTIFSSIDEVEAHRLKFKMLQCFGESSSVADIVWQKRYAPDIRTAISDAYEYILAFATDTEAFRDTRNKLPLTEAQTKQFKNPDQDSRGPWKAADFTAQGYRPNQMYSIKVPSGRSVTPPAGRCWAVTESVYFQYVKDDVMFYGSDGDGVPAVKRFLSDMDGMVPWTWWAHQDVGHSQDGLKAIMQLFGREEAFLTAKPPSLIERIARIATDIRGTMLDFFAGSGTTGHAIINLNREDGGHRKYILVEMGEHFETVLKPRIQKVIYSKDWKDGKPVSREGSSHLFKYLRLESYEDALNNLELRRKPDQDELLRENAPLREDYLLRYQLDVETRESASLLDIAQFANPFAYQLKIATGSVGETRPVNVDLVETFNYLLGLRVGHLDTIRGFRIVTGLSPAGEKVLIIWRNTAEKSNADLDAFFQKQGYNTKDMEFAFIYVNGDNNLENLKRGDETWKVRRTEDEFKRLMFDVQVV